MTDLLPCPFCGSPAISQKPDGDTFIAKCSSGNKRCSGDWWSSVDQWNKRAYGQDDVFEQFRASLAESERKLKIAQRKLERIDALIEQGCRVIGDEMLVILPIQAILGENDE